MAQHSFLGLTKLTLSLALILGPKGGFSFKKPDAAKSSSCLSALNNHDAFSTITTEVRARKRPLIPSPESNAGGFGRVTKSQSSRHGTVAIKTSLTIKKEKDLERESNLLKEINKKNPPKGIPKFYSFSKDEKGRGALTTDWIEGKTLFDENNTPLTRSNFKEKSLAFLDQIQSTLTTLDWMHQKGFLHLDIKGQNIMIQPNGEVKIIDFGNAATFNHAGLIDAGEAYTSYYSAPEYLSSLSSVAKKMKAEDISHETIGPKADVYSVGRIISSWLDIREKESDNLSLPMKGIIGDIINFLEIPMTQHHASQRINLQEALSRIELIRTSIKDKLN
jgi:serine/threonine protein kinase